MRICVIAVVAAVFVGLASLWAHGVYEPWGGWEHIRNRDRWPRLGLWPKLVGECLLFALISVGGRVILRLRLVDRERR